MGTRHLIAIQVNNEYKVAQYGQWDGYPDGQGKDILKFLRETNLEQFKDKVLLTSWITEDEDIERWNKLGIDIVAKGGWLTQEESREHKRLYPELDRSCGSDILGLIYNSNGLKLQNSIDFAHNGLSCEWAYIIDFDKNTFEVYGGCNDSPLDEGERFYEGDEKFSDGYYNGRGLGFKYYGVRCLKVFDLFDLPTEEEFLKTFEVEDKTV